jgi:hypothetical protein
MQLAGRASATIRQPRIDPPSALCGALQHAKYIAPGVIWLPLKQFRF